jgi:hypothetical protein
MDDIEELLDDEGLQGSPFRVAALRDGQPPGSGFSLGLWRSSGDLAATALFDPFVLALAQGTLPK